MSAIEQTKRWTEVYYTQLELIHSRMDLVLSFRKGELTTPKQHSAEQQYIQGALQHLDNAFNQLEGLQINTAKHTCAVSAQRLPPTTQHNSRILR